MKLCIRNGERKMEHENQVSLSKVANIMAIGGAIALALVGLVWGLLGIFVL